MKTLKKLWIQVRLWFAGYCAVHDRITPGGYCQSCVMDYNTRKRAKKAGKVQQQIERYQELARQLNNQK